MAHANDAKRTVAPSFINYNDKRLFVLNVRPELDHPDKVAMVVFPPFEEEMNRCRFFVSQLSERLCALGIATIMLDPHGTGDSSGKTLDICWQGLVDDLLFSCEQALNLGYEKLILLGTRFGAMLIEDVACRIAQHIDRICVVQPVLDGEAYVNHLIRLKTAASIIRHVKDEKTSRFTVEDLEQGTDLYFSGYEYSSSLCLEIRRRVFLQKLFEPAIEMDWFACRASEERPISPATVKAIEARKSDGYKIELHDVISPAIWNAAERYEDHRLADQIYLRLETVYGKPNL